jgi:hypothetical protein
VVRDITSLSDHDVLSVLGLSWLISMGCAVASNEININGGVADAVGFGITSGKQRGILIESKVSRSDFHRDKKKWHRKHYCDAAHGISDRYYIAPPGMLTADDLPDGWGLLEPGHSDFGDNTLWGYAVVVKRARYSEPDPGWWAHHFATVARINNMRLLQERYFGEDYPPASRIVIPGMPEELARRLAPLKHTTTSGPRSAELFGATASPTP